MKKVINKIMSCLGHVSKAEVISKSDMIAQNSALTSVKKISVHDRVKRGALRVGASDEQADYEGRLAVEWMVYGFNLGVMSHCTWLEACLNEKKGGKA
jgi:hypothetical protein